MRTALFGLIWITACYAPRAQSGAPCTTDSQCPEGQSCQGGFCGGQDPDGGSPDAPPGTVDTDNDHVPDNLDNCRTTANTDQLDEDGDKIGDACDLCPQIANAAATDSDGDGLPDACDPNPTGTTRDTQWLFEGFPAGLPKLWTADTGWGPGSTNGTLLVTVPGGNAEYQFLTLPLTSSGRSSYDNYELIIAFTITSADSAGSEIGIDLYDSSSKHDAYCSLYNNPNKGGLRLGAYELKMDGSTAADGTKNFSWQTNVQYTLTMLRRGSSGTTVTCTVAGPSGQPTLMANLNATVVPRSGGASFLMAYGVTARIDWVYVAGTP